MTELFMKRGEAITAQRADATTDARQDGSARPAPALPDDYYLTAFQAVLSVVDASAGPILTDREREWSRVLADLDEDARRLYIRLLMRKRSVFRLERLDYPEIGDLAAARATLIAAGLASGAPPTTLETLLSAFTRPEIDRLLDVPADAGSRRRERVAALLHRAAPADRARLAAAATWLTPLGHDVFSIYRLCFFGNLRQDLSEFVRDDLGSVRYERYPLERDGALFQTRAQLDAHLRFYECELLFETGGARDADALESVVQRLPEHVPGDRPLERRLDRLRLEIARRFERLELPLRALALYAGSRRPPARERRVRLLAALGRADEAAVLLEAMVDDPIDEAERAFAERRSGRRRKPFRPPTTALILKPTGRRVERVAAAFYASRGPCHWTENRLVTGMFGLWCWDILFHPVPGAFFHPFQIGPADVRDRGFRDARAALFDARFAELDAPDAAVLMARRVRSRWQASHGTANPLIGWSALDAELLELALVRIPPAHWRAMFDRLLDDLAEHGSGLPDLVHFPDVGGYEFIEIKGPGDALQAHQRRWLEHFSAHRIPARVVNVRWAGPAAAP